jgi:hypothetical protein
MPFQLVAHDLLKVGIKESIKSEILHHSPGYKVNIDKLDEGIKEVLKKTSSGRDIQANILLKFMDLTSALPSESDEEKTVQARILNAAVYHLRRQIELSYLNGLANRSPTKSAFFNYLTTSLNLTKDNSPSPHEIVVMYKELESFFRKHTYKDSDPVKGYLDLPAFAIEGFSVEDDISDLKSKILALELTIIQTAKKLQDDSKDKKGGKGFLSAFWGGRENASGKKTTLIQEDSDATSTVAASK